MYPNRDWFSTYNGYIDGVILMGNNAKCKAIEIGTVSIKTQDGMIRTLENVRHLRMYGQKKVVIKVCMDERASKFCCFRIKNPFCCFGIKNPRSEVLSLAGGFPGVQSVALVGDRDQIDVTGVVDPVDLTTLLRKKVGFSEIVSVGEAKKEDESKDKDKKDGMPVGWPYPPYPRQEIVYVQPDSWCLAL
ncbi:uncharacterized protein LOC130139163 [Syzygium oleosum]|uniref:uncharacterized protein LOC130139163 n=1 Tax=Syzygium oleosum TaxID=219896 RepID=UPI0024B99EE7|nr:uncharacterized protein LOC130139163 [Syzygium oleosum]